MGNPIPGVDAEVTIDRTEHLMQVLERARDEARASATQAEDPRLRAMSATTAEVLDALHRSFRDYEDRSGPEWV
jgi:hypothetical protein